MYGNIFAGGGGEPINDILHSILTQWTTTQNNEEEKAKEEERWGYFLLKRHNNDIARLDPGSRWRNLYTRIMIIRR